MREKIIISGIRFDKLNFNQAFEIIDKATSHDEKKIFVATPNPEMLMESINNVYLKNILNKTDLNIADGTGVLWAARYLSLSSKSHSVLKKSLLAISTLFEIIFRPRALKTTLPERVTGTDMMLKICASADRKKKIFLLGAAEGVAAKTKIILQNRYNCQIVGALAGSPSIEEKNHICDIIEKSGANILFVAFGSPKQEIWLYENIPHLNNIKVAMGIGGAFDFISGNKKRAPEIMQKSGLEWLFRLIQEPNRITRIINATIIFPLMIISSSFRRR